MAITLGNLSTAILGGLGFNGYGATLFMALQSNTYMAQMA
jgi:hypothetical protein